MCAYYCEELPYTTAQNSSDNFPNFPSYPPDIITAQMMCLLELGEGINSPDFFYLGRATLQTEQAVQTLTAHSHQARLRPSTSVDARRATDVDGRRRARCEWAFMYAQTQSAMGQNTRLIGYVQSNVFATQASKEANIKQLGLRYRSRTS